MPSHQHWRRSQAWLQTIVSVLAGFALAQASNWYTADRQQASEFERTRKRVQQELSFDFQAAVAITQIIRADVEVSPQNKDVLQPLPNLSTSAMDAAFLSGSLGYKDADLTLLVGSISASMKLTNDDVRNLETYKLTNGAMDNYQRRKPLIETMISETIQAQSDAWLGAFKRIVDAGR